MLTKFCLLVISVALSCQSVIAGDLLFKKDFEAQSSSIQVDFGTAIIENRNVGKLHIKHKPNEKVTILGTSCGCSIARIEVINDQQTDMVVELRSGFARDVSSTVEFSVGDDNKKTVELTGKLISGIHVSPAIAVIDDNGRVSSLDVYWDPSLVESPDIEISDSRFSIDSVERLPAGLRLSLAPSTDFRLKDVGFLGQITFALTEGKKVLRFDVPLRSKNAVSPIIPRKTALDPDSLDNIRLVALTNKDAPGTEFSLVFITAEGEKSLEIASTQVREKSTILVVKTSSEFRQQLNDNSIVEAEVRCRASGTELWKTLGNVTFVSISGEKK